MLGRSEKFSKLRNSFYRGLRAEDGATAIEYSLIAAGVSIAISAVVFTIGTTLSDDIFTPILAGF